MSEGVVWLMEREFKVNWGYVWLDLCACCMFAGMCMCVCVLCVCDECSPQFDQSLTGHVRSSQVSENGSYLCHVDRPLHGVLSKSEVGHQRPCFD